MAVLAGSCIIALLVLFGCSGDLDADGGVLEQTDFYYSKLQDPDGEDDSATEDPEAVEPTLLDGSTVSGEIHVTVDVHSNIDEVRFFLNDSADPIKIDTARPFELHLDTTELADGGHTLIARAPVGRHGRNTRVVAEASFHVNNQEPESDEASDEGDDEPSEDPEAGWLALTVNPDNAEVTVEGPQDFQETFVGDKVLEVNPGTYTVTAELTDYESETASADVAAGETTQIDLVLSRSISAEPSPYEDLIQLYVDPEQGADSNPGTQQAPLRTLNEAIRQARDNRNRGEGTRILLYPGTYREGIDTTFDGSGGEQPLIVIEAVETGAATISGSDVWTDWNCSSSSSLCTHHWPYDWGLAENPWARWREIEPLGLRREMIFVDGIHLDQKLALSELAPGTFYVDEENETVHVHPPSGVDMKSATVEVAARETLFRAQGLNDLVIKGIVFQHAASPVSNGAVQIVDQRRVHLEDLLVQYNNWGGLWFKGYDITLLRSVMNHNGANGVGAFQVANLILEDTESSYNNWRGYAGGMTGWAVGNKFLHVHDLVIRRHVSENNLSRGLWLDSDIKNAVLEEIVACNNLGEGIKLEFAQGPLVVRNSTFCNNLRAGILTAAVNNFTLEQNNLYGNDHSQLNMSGSFNTTVRDFQTGESMVLNNENWFWRNNSMAANHDGQLLTSTTFPRDEWDSLMSTSDLDYNEYSGTRDDIFRVPGGTTLTLSGWQKDTGQDANSTFTDIP